MEQEQSENDDSDDEENYYESEANQIKTFKKLGAKLF